MHCTLAPLFSISRTSASDEMGVDSSPISLRRRGYQATASVYKQPHFEENIKRPDGQIVSWPRHYGLVGTSTQEYATSDGKQLGILSTCISTK